MDVTCERCGTEYEFDETLLSARGTSVKCTNCGHVFKVYPAAQQGADRATSTWRLQHRDGTVETIDSLRELQRRIASGELTPHDRISRSEEGWKALGSIPELETFFHAARGDGTTSESPSPYPPPAAAPTSRTPSSTPPRRRPRQPTLLGVVPVPKAPSSSKSGATLTPVPALDARDEVSAAPTPKAEDAAARAADRSIQKVRERQDTGTDSERLPEASEPPGVVIVAADESLRLPETEPEPPRAMSPEVEEAEFEEAAPSRSRSTPPPAYYDDDDDIPELPGRGWSPARWLVIVTLIGLVGVVAANFDRARELVGLGAPADTTAQAVADGDEAMTAAHLDAYQRAITAYQAALDAGTDADGALFAKLSRAHALAAQAIRDGADSPTTSKEQHAKAALDYAEQALMTDPRNLEARLAEADALRLAGDIEKARESLERARLMPFSRTAEFYRIDALLAADEHDGDLAKGARSAREAAAAASDEPRYQLLLARAELASGDLKRARGETERLLAAYPAHPAATMLLAAIEAAKRDADAVDEEEAAEGEGQGADASPNSEPETEAPAQDEPATAKTTDGVEEPPPAEAAPPEPAAPVATPAPAKPVATPEVAPEKRSARTSRPNPRPSYDEYDRLAEAAGSDAFVDGRPPIRDFGWYMREGEAALAGGDYTKARAFFESALEARPGSGDATDALGRVAFASGQYDLAARYFRSAAQRGHPDGYYSLGRAYERLGKNDEAVSAYYTYLKRRPTGTHVSDARAAILKLEPRVKLPEPEEPNAEPDAPGDDSSGSSKEPEATTP